MTLTTGKKCGFKVDYWKNEWISLVLKDEVKIVYIRLLCRFYWFLIVLYGIRSQNVRF